MAVLIFGYHDFCKIVSYAENSIYYTPCISKVEWMIMNDTGKKDNEKIASPAVLVLADRWVLMILHDGLRRHRYFKERSHLK